MAYGVFRLEDLRHTRRSFMGIARRSLMTKVLALALMSFLLFCVARPVLAHAVPVTSNPAANAILETAPTELSITFNEPVVPALSQIVLLNRTAEEVAVGSVQAVDAENLTLAVSLPDLEDGAYLVSWQVLSTVDGHTTSGSFAFGVGVAELSAVSQEVTITAQLSPLSAAARWLTLTAVALLLGLFTFRLFVWNPIVIGVELDATEEQLDLSVARASLKLGLLGLVLLGIGLLLIFIDQANSYNLFQDSNITAWADTRFGSTWLMRLLFMAALGFWLASLWKEVDDSRSALRGWEWWVGLLLGIGLALSSSLTSHSAAMAQNTTTAIAVDLAHTLAAGIWVGGLVYLALALWQVRVLSPESRAWFNLSLILHFSAIAAISVGILLATGTYLAWQHVGSWTALVGTAYGLTLLAKIGLALAAFAIAAINLLFIKPRLARAYDDPNGAAAGVTMRRFGRLVRVEAFLALVVLLAAGILSDLQRGEDAPLLADAPGKTVLTGTADDVNVSLTIEPALVGPNSFDVFLTDTDGNPIPDAEEVTLRYTYLGQSIGAADTVANSQGDGHYQAEGSYISVIGGWQVEVAIRRPGAFDTFVPFRLEAGLGGNILATDQSPLLEQFARTMTLFGGAATGSALVLFAILWGLIAIRVARTSSQLVALLLLSLGAFWLGADQLITFFDREYTPGKFLTNPILPDADSIVAGEVLYETNCVPCHGPTGRGDGPSAASFRPPPADFGAGHTASHPDGDLYSWIQTGIAGSAMPAFEDKLSDEETWHLVNYVRRLGALAAQSYENNSQ